MEYLGLDFLTESHSFLVMILIAVQGTVGIYEVIRYFVYKTDNKDNKDEPRDSDR